MTSRLSTFATIFTIFIGALYLIDSFRSGETVYDIVNQGPLYLAFIIVAQTHWFAFIIIFPLALVSRSKIKHQKITSRTISYSLAFSILAGFLISWAIRFTYVAVTGEWYPWQTIQETFFQLVLSAVILMSLGILFIYGAFSGKKRLLIDFVD